jgi:RNA polymerase sigma-70 factor, ECF subfamily
VNAYQFYGEKEAGFRIFFDKTVSRGYYDYRIERDTASMAKSETHSFALLEKLYHEHKDMFLRYLLRMTYNRETAEDLLHDSFVSMAEKFGQLKDPRKFRPWGYTICLNSFRIWYRERAKKPVPVSNPQEFQDPRTSGGSGEPSAFTKVLQEFSSGLGEEDRSIFVLAHWQNMPYKSIAESLEISERTVKRRMSIMIGKLSGLLCREHLIAGKNCDPGGD